MIDAANPSRREQKKAEVREALVQSADVLFFEHGYDATTVDQIAEKAGVSRRTFFRYFPSKEAIAFPLSAERLEAFRALLSARVADENVLVAVRAACLEIGALLIKAREGELRRHAVVSKSPALLAAELEVYRQWEGAIADAVIRSEASDDRIRYGRLFAAATIGIVRLVLREWYDSGGEKDPVRLFDEAFGLLETGFSAHL